MINLSISESSTDSLTPVLKTDEESIVAVRFVISLSEQPDDWAIDERWDYDWPEFWYPFSGLDENTTYWIWAYVYASKDANENDYTNRAVISATTWGTYSITYSAETGVEVPDWESFECGDDGTTITISDVVPEKSMYEFKRWKLVKNGDVVGYAQPGEEISVTRGYYTAVAEWTAKTAYTITYNGNGGTGVPARQTFYYGEVFAVSSTVPTLTGYVFDDWAMLSTDGDCFGYAQPGEEIAISKDSDEDRNVTFVAEWYGQLVTVVGGDYVKVHAGGSGMKSFKLGVPYIDYEGNKASSYTVYAEIQETPGYEITFDGWYKDGVKVSSDLSYYVGDVTEDYTLTAQAAAKKITYDITLTCDRGVDVTSLTGGGTVGTESPTTVSCALRELENAAVKFDGWWKIHENGESIKELLTTEQTYTFTPDANVTLKAQTIITDIVPPARGAGDTAVAAAIDGAWKKGTAYYGVDGKWLKASVYKGINGQWLGSSAARMVTITPAAGDKYIANVSPAVEVLTGSTVTVRSRTADSDMVLGFDGWYNEDGTKLSSDWEYTFKAKKNLTMTAKVEAIPAYTLTLIDYTNSQYGYCAIAYNGEQVAKDATTLELLQGESVTVTVKTSGAYGGNSAAIYLNGDEVDRDYELEQAAIAKYEYTPTADAEIEFEWKCVNISESSKAYITEGG